VSAVMGLNVVKLEVYGAILAVVLLSAGLAYWYAYHSGYAAANLEWEKKSAANAQLHADQVAILDKLASTDNSKLSAKLDRTNALLTDLRKTSTAAPKAVAVFPPGCNVSPKVVAEFNAAVEAANAGK